MSVEIASLVVGISSLVCSGPALGTTIASLTGDNSHQYLTWKDFEKLFDGMPKEVVQNMWTEYSSEKRYVESWKDSYGHGVSCKMIFINATELHINRGSTVKIFMGKKTNDKKVYFFPQIKPGGTKTAFHAKRDGAAVGCGGAMEFFLEGKHDEPWWAVGWKVPYSGANATDSQVDTCVGVADHLEKEHVAYSSSTTFLHGNKYQLDSFITSGTTAILHIILRKMSG